MTDAAAAVRALCADDDEFAALVALHRAALDRWSAEDVLPDEAVRGSRVLDWGCGRGTFSALFLERGARSITGIDAGLNAGWVERGLSRLPGARFVRASLDELAREGTCDGAFDLVFGNTITEHVPELARVLAVCHRVLDAGGLLVLNHDNYYQPVGSKDHGMLYFGGDDEIVFQGPRCWETEERCDTSADFRRVLSERARWTWDDWTELQLSPEDCRRCPYYRRAQPWAHLLWQAEFREVFPQAAFTSGYRPSLLNKVTPFQLRQFLIEAGFDVERWVPYRVNNVPPPELLAPPFNLNADDLRTATIAIRCRKGPLASYHLTEPPRRG